jgi:hypothetical protein
MHGHSKVIYAVAVTRRRLATETASPRSPEIFSETELNTTPLPRRSRARRIRSLTLFTAREPARCAVKSSSAAWLELYPRSIQDSKCRCLECGRNGEEAAWQPDRPPGNNANSIRNGVSPSYPISAIPSHRLFLDI